VYVQQKIEAEGSGVGWDWAFDWSFLQQYHVSAGINNLLDAAYFSHRIIMYPGPGILPADGRTFYISLGCRL
jgi:Fe(3+) dicitrate transport protein